MSRLAGFTYREVARKLRIFGFVFDRQGPGSHEIWRHEVTGRKVTIPHTTHATWPEAPCGPSSAKPVSTWANS